MKFVVAKEQCRLDIVFDSFELFKLFATKNQNLFSRFYIWVFFVWAELVNLFLMWRFQPFHSHFISIWLRLVATIINQIWQKVQDLVLWQITFFHSFQYRVCPLWIQFGADAEQLFKKTADSRSEVRHGQETIQSDLKWGGSREFILTRLYILCLYCRVVPWQSQFT